MIHNPFVHQFSRDLARLSRTRFVEVFLARHADPWSPAIISGFICVGRKNKVSKHQTPSTDSVNDVKLPEVTGGMPCSV
jgi:hypothetical protein